MIIGKNMEGSGTICLLGANKTTQTCNQDNLSPGPESALTSSQFPNTNREVKS
jgi:hypothetical protein